MEDRGNLRLVLVWGWVLEGCRRGIPASMCKKVAVVQPCDERAFLGVSGCWEFFFCLLS